LTGGGFDWIVNGGPTQVGVESTVLSLISEPPVLKRAEMVDLDQLRKRIPAIRVSDPQTPDATSVRRSPGQSSQHYAPDAELILVEDEQSLPDDPQAEQPVGWVDHRAETEPLEGFDSKARTLPADPPGYAEKLYDNLHGMLKNLHRPITGRGALARSPGPPCASVFELPRSNLTLF